MYSFVVSAPPLSPPVTSPPRGGRVVQGARRARYSNSLFRRGTALATGQREDLPSPPLWGRCRHGRQRGVAAAASPSVVMPGLDPGIHAVSAHHELDPRVEPEDDGIEVRP